MHQLQFFSNLSNSNAVNNTCYVATMSDLLFWSIDISIGVILYPVSNLWNTVQLCILDTYIITRQ